MTSRFVRQIFLMGFQLSTGSHTLLTAVPVKVQSRLDDSLNVISKQFLADEETVKKAVEKVARILPS